MPTSATLVSAGPESILPVELSTLRVLVVDDQEDVRRGTGPLVQVVRDAGAGSFSKSQYIPIALTASLKVLKSTGLAMKLFTTSISSRDRCQFAAPALRTRASSRAARPCGDRTGSPQARRSTRRRSETESPVDPPGNAAR